MTYGTNHMKDIDMDGHPDEYLEKEIQANTVQIIIQASLIYRRLNGLIDLLSTYKW